VGAGYPHIIFRFTESEIHARMSRTGSDFWTAYVGYLDHWKAALTKAGVYHRIQLYKIADEPAVHPEIFVDQAFLDRYVAEFEARFVGKKSIISFAGTMQHPLDRILPPKALDIILMDPYFLAAGDTTPCDDEQIRQFLYEDSPHSPVGWALKFNKPIIVAGDAMLRETTPPRTCYVTGTLNALADDPRVAGLVWFVYDRSFVEGPLRGAANAPAFVERVRRASVALP
jgi:hypothetical protein